DPQALVSLGRVVGSLVACLGPEEVGKVAGPAIGKLLDGMTRTVDLNSRADLAAVLRPLAAHLGPEDAARNIRTALDAMAGAGPAFIEHSLDPFVQSVESLAARLTPEKADEVMPRALGAMGGRTIDVYLFSSVARAVEALATRLRPEQAHKAS